MLRFIRAIKLTAAVLIAVLALAGASTESRAQTGRYGCILLRPDSLSVLAAEAGS
jgi:hypothetical protein